MIFSNFQTYTLNKWLNDDDLIGKRMEASISGDRITVAKCGTNILLWSGASLELALFCFHGPPKKAKGMHQN